MSAVSKKLMPASSAAWTTRSVAARVDAHPEVVAAEADDRDAQRSDRTMLHPDRIRLRIDLAQERAQRLIELVGLFHHQEVRRAGDLVILDFREDARDCLA